MLNHCFKLGLTLLGLLLGGLILGGVGQAQESNAAELMLEANQLYEAGEYAQASELYERVESLGVRDSALFYNLGNAYFRQGEVGQAILNYRLAQRLSPRDDDIRYNLSLARSQTQDPLDMDSETLLEQVTRLAQGWLSINEMAWLALLIWFITAALIGGYIQVRQTESTLKHIVQFGLALSLMLLLGGIFSLGGRIYLEVIRPQGVILADEVIVTSGPGTQYVDEFILNSGAEVNVLDERNNWFQVALPGGDLEGWVPSSSLGLVVSD